ncbi:hypothetical protein [Streptomyces scopuliridis]|uniref:Translation initiation factor 2 n=1 Tax=Streptomyces scopuliridis RB72 TaxID=1440053 RepID=A0A2T7T9N8_9ACTN|nr:hypothetical protein [Streptomyces scopuliridis]PVE11863.1 hypothetical protein Y717_07430 [Streptomyces scopuliridis RB72]
MGEGRAGWVRVPVGADSARWTTRGRCKLVLFVVHNVTSATRLLDVLPLFRDDLRVQLLATWTGSSPFRAGVAELLAETGIPVLPWEQALELPVELAISASFGGQLHALSRKLTVLSHGVGYNKRLATPDTGHRTPDTGCPSPEARGRTPDAGPPPVFGLSPDWLLADGSPVADALVLSHPEQLERLRAACPEAVPTAVLAGDPCFDRILAALPYRERFRRALDVRPGQRLVLLNSTWNPDSLFGDGGEDILPSLLPRLTAELPADEYRPAAVLHPNIWHGHGPGQIRVWLDRARRGGLALVDPLEGWRQALIAADVVIGDAGSVSYYAAALGTPVLMGAASPDGLDARSPVAAFVRQAPRLSPYAPLRVQLDALLDGAGRRQPETVPGPAELVSSAPGQAATLLRRHFYRLIGIPEPEEPALLDPLPLPPYERVTRTAPMRVVTRLLGTGEIEVSRYADPRSEPAGDGDAHTAVHEDTLDPDRRALADVIFRYGTVDDPRYGTPEEWTAEVLARHPYCALAALVTDRGSCTVRTRAGILLRLSGASAAADPAAYVSALHAWLAAGKAWEELAAGGMTVRTGGGGSHQVSVTPVTPDHLGGPGGSDSPLTPPR